MDDKFKKKIKELLEKYSNKTFMYIEYPHKSFWSKDFSEEEFKKALLLLGSEKKDSPLMLYVHIPYCKIQCFYCTCHTCIMNDYKEVKEYLGYLYKEMQIIKEFLEKNSIKPNFKEVHIGGGSPTILNEEDFNILIDKIDSLVNIKNLREFSLEIDPRFVDKEKLRYYSSEGINRISFGIQDFELDVQKAINRVQPVDMVEKLMTSEIRKWFSHGINFDILCGLPNQTTETIKRTFETIVRLSPDRVCFNYLDFSPKYAKHQMIMIDGKNGRPLSLPNEYERKMIFLTGSEVLLKNEYVKIGYDHFAIASDEVVKSLVEGKLKWNALGVTTGDYSDVIAVGPNSTSTIGNYYSQNLYFNEGYYDKLKNGNLPIYRGYELNKDDLIRREVIQTIRNFGVINYQELGEKLKIDFKKYFMNEIESLKEFEKDGILIQNQEGFKITKVGKEFVLYVCSKFDKY